MKRAIKKVATLAALLVLPACDGGGGGERIARPDELRLSIVRGRDQMGQVRAGAANLLQVNDPGLLPEPVVVRVSVVGSASVGVTAAGPALATIPAGAIVNWRVVGAGCDAAPYANVTAVEAGGADSVLNYWRKGTKATECRMVAEGVAGGVPFGSDTAVATFSPGPYVGGYSFERGTQGTTHVALVLDPALLHDVHGNPIPFRIAVDSAHAPWVVPVGGAVGTVAGRSLNWQYEGLPQALSGDIQLLVEGDSVAATARFEISKNLGRFTYRLP